jgi:aryl-alcohol dehydrogenase-like predicted oxidoreductase
MSSDAIRTVTLGSCGVEVCRVSCGTGTIAGGGESNQTRLGADPFNDILRHAYDRGIRFFDTADAYGTHPHVARAISGRDRNEFQLVTKCHAREHVPDAVPPIERFVEELGTNRFDVLQIHCVTTPNWVEQNREQMDTLAELKSRGVIGAHGVSCHSLVALEVAAEDPWVDVIHARINPFEMDMDASPDKVVPVLERAKANGKGIIGMKLFGQGKMDAAQRAESIAWVGSLDCVDVLLVAFESCAEVDEFLALI